MHLNLNPKFYLAAEGKLKRNIPHKVKRKFQE